MTCTYNVSDLPERIASKIEVAENGCWVWTASKTNQGYAQVNRQGKTSTAHRVVYELLVSKIPEGLQLDHICRVRHCVCPSHLEPVTQCENILRGVGVAAVNAAKTHCAHGHELSTDNLVPFDWIKLGKRICLICSRACDRKRNKVRYAKLRAARLAQQQAVQQ